MTKVNRSGDGPNFPRETMEAADLSGSAAGSRIAKLGKWMTNTNLSMKGHSVEQIRPGGTRDTLSTTKAGRVAQGVMRKVGINSWKKH